MVAVLNPFVPILSLTGNGLNNGTVYIGVVNEDPQTNPQAVYWDAGLTIPATQPLDVLGGYIVRTGTATQAFTASNYSITVLDSQGVLVFSVPEAIPPEEFVPAGPIPASGLTMNTGKVLARWDSGTGAVEEAVPATGLRLAAGLLSVIPRSATPVASFGATLAWNSDSYDLYEATAQAANLTINADLGSPVNGQKWIIRITDNGTPRTLTWTTGATHSFRPIGITLPTTTVANKLVEIGCVYNAPASRWDAVALAQEA